MFALAVALLATAVGCGGGGSVPNGSTVNFSPAPSATTTGNLTQAAAQITVVLPASSAPSSKHKPTYLSPGTQSVSVQLVSVNGTPVPGSGDGTIIPTYGGAPNCSSGSAGMSCTATLNAYVGQDLFSVVAYSGANATGSVLASGSVIQTIAAGGGNVTISNALSVSIGGVIANLSVALANQQLPIGILASDNVVVNALDASGATIVAPGTFTTPVSLTTSDQTGSFGFTTASNTTPNATISITQPTNVALAYNGSTTVSPGQVTITAASGSLNAAVNLLMVVPTPTPSPSPTPTPFGATPSPIPSPAALLYVLNGGTNGGQNATITEYPLDANGNLIATTPYDTLNLSSSLNAVSMTVDKSGNIYVGYFDNFWATSYAAGNYSPYTSGGYFAYSFVDASTGATDTGNVIDVYAKGSTGNAAPTRQIASDPGGASNQTILDPGELYVDATGNILTVGVTTVNGQATSSTGNGTSVVQYGPSASGAVEPSQAWVGANFDIDGFDGDSCNTAALSAVFSNCGFTTVGWTSQMTEDSSGNLYVGWANISGESIINAISVDTPADFSNGYTETQTINLGSGAAPPPTLFPDGIAVDGNGNLWVTIYNTATNTASLYRYHAGTASNGAPTTSTDPTLNLASGCGGPYLGQYPQLPLAVMSANVYIANQCSNSIVLYSVSNASFSQVINGLSTPIAIAVGPIGGPGTIGASHRHVAPAFAVVEPRWLTPSHAIVRGPMMGRVFRTPRPRRSRP